MLSVIDKVNFFLHEKDPLPLSIEDVFSSLNGLLFFASTLAEAGGYSSSFMKSVSNWIGFLSMIPESILMVRTVNDAASVAPEIALAGARMALLHQVHTNPSLKPVALILDAYGVYSVFARVCKELYKCWKYAENGEANPLFIARNVCVHGINASYSTYKAAILWEGFHSFLEKNTAESSKEFLQNRAQTVKGINGLQNSALSEELRSCRILYYDPNCKTLAEGRSTCAPICEKLTQKEIRNQYDLMVRTTLPFDEQGQVKKVHSVLEQVKDFLLSLADKREKKIREAATKIASVTKEADHILALKRRYPNSHAFASQVLGSDVSNLIHRIFTGKDKTWMRKKEFEIEELNAVCRTKAALVHVDKINGAGQAIKDKAQEASALLNVACDTVKDLYAGKKTVEVIQKAKKTYPCSLFDEACRLMNLTKSSSWFDKRSLRNAELSDEFLFQETDTLFLWLPKSVLELFRYKNYMSRPSEGAVQKIRELKFGLKQEISNSDQDLRKLEIFIFQLKDQMESLKNNDLIHRISAYSRNLFNQYEDPTSHISSVRVQERILDADIALSKGEQFVIHVKDDLQKAIDQSNSRKNEIEQDKEYLKSLLEEIDSWKHFLRQAGFVKRFWQQDSTALLSKSYR